MGINRKEKFYPHHATSIVAANRQLRRSDDGAKCRAGLPELTAEVRTIRLLESLVPA
jgi:hypothetical protein